ncbi:MAG: OmpA family protein [Myxococcota bacterium]
MWTRVLLVPLAATLTVGCVTKSKYDALAHDLDETEAALRMEQAAQRSAYEEQLAQRTGEAQTLGSALEQATKDREGYRRQVIALETEMANQDAELARLEQRLAGTEKELAAVIERRSALKASLDQMESALGELRARQQAADRRVADYRAMLERFASLIDAGKLEVKVVDGRMVLALPMDILFSSGQASLTEPGHASLLEVAEVLATIPKRNFQVEGHTDNVPIKTTKFPSNWELGAARALVVLDALEEGGVPSSQLSAASYGEFRPAGRNDDAAGRSSNRRIEIVVMPDLSALPGYDELNRLSNGK